MNNVRKVHGFHVYNENWIDTDKSVNNFDQKKKDSLSVSKINEHVFNIQKYIMYPTGIC